MFGVINLVLKNEQEAPALMAGGGSHGTSIASGRFVHDAGGGFNMSLAASMQNDAGQNLYFKEFDTPENNHGVSSGHDYDNYRSLMGTLTGHGMRFLALTSSRTKGIPTAWYGTTFNGEQQFTDGRHLLSLTSERRTSPTKQLFLRTSYDRYDYHGRFPFPEHTVTDHSVSTRLDADLRYVWDVKPNHRVTFGTEYVDNVRASYQKVNGSDIRDIGGPFSVASAYVQSEFQALHSLSVTAGLRYDRYARVTQTLNPSAAILWHTNDANTFKLLYGSAFRLPTVFELGFEDADQNFIPNPELQPERIRQIELVWEGRITPEVLVRVSPYRLQMTGLIQTQTDAVDGQTRYMNLTDVTSQGVEMQADYRRGDGLWSYLSYSRQSAMDQGVRMVNSPANLAKGGFSTPTSRQFQGAVELIYESGRKTFAGNVTPGVFLTNLTLSTALRSRMRLSVAVKNLLNTPYSTPGGPPLIQDTLQQNGRTILIRLHVGG
jgi:iron complex outermembrane receptor protein